MSALAKPALPRMTVAEFIAWPGDGSGLKHQLIDGEVQAMAPASTTHGRIQAALARLLGNHLVGTGCSRGDRAGRRSSDPCRVQYAGPRYCRYLHSR